MRRSALVLAVVLTSLMAMALPLGAGEIPGKADADFVFTDYPDDPEEPFQHLDVFVNEATGESSLRWEALDPDTMEPIEGAWFEGEVACVTFLDKSVLVGYEAVATGASVPFFEGMWNYLELIDGGAGLDGDVMLSPKVELDEVTADDVFAVCAAEEHVPWDEEFYWVTYPTDGYIYVAQTTGKDRAVTINERYSIPEDRDLVPDQGMLNFGCEGGLYELVEGDFRLMMQTIDTESTVRMRVRSDLDGTLEIWDTNVICEAGSEEGCRNEIVQTGEFFDLEQDTGRMNLVLDQYTGVPISGSVYGKAEIYDLDTGEMVEWMHWDGDYVDGEFIGVMEGTCGIEPEYRCPEVLVDEPTNYQLLGSPPDSVVAGAIESDTLATVFLEAGPVDVTDLDLDDPDEFHSGKVCSYYVHTDPVGGNHERITGSLTFDAPVRGLIQFAPGLDASAAVLNAEGTIYPDPYADAAGVEEEPYWMYNEDVLSFTEGTVDFDLMVAGFTDDFRIILEAIPTG